MKKVKYKLGIQTYNTECVWIEITKTAYRSLIKKYTEMAQCSEETDRLAEGYFEVTERTEDKGTYINYYTEMNDGATYIMMVQVECKPGYYFNTK